MAAPFHARRPRRMKIVLRKLEGNWHMVIDGGAAIKTPFFDHAERRDVIAYVYRAFPRAEVYEGTHG
jgi:hypothetical protein